MHLLSQEQINQIKEWQKQNLPIKQIKILAKDQFNIIGLITR